MDTIDLNLTTPTDVTVSPNSSREVYVSIEDVEKSQVLDHFDAEDVANHFDHEALLKEIGSDKAVEYFGFELKEDK